MYGKVEDLVERIALVLEQIEELPKEQRNCSPLAQELGALLEAYADYRRHNKYPKPAAEIIESLFSEANSTER